MTNRLTLNWLANVTFEPPPVSEIAGILFTRDLPLQ